MTRADLEPWIERSERPMLVLAAAAVAIYLVDLLGWWRATGLQGGYLAFAIDACFVADLALKLGVMRGRYLRSPWFLVDLVCTVPILSTLSVFPSALLGLRFVRMFRILRALRMLRVLRSLRVLRLLQRGAETVEQRTYNRVLAVAVAAYTVAFVALVTVGRQGAPPGQVVGMLGADLPETVEVRVQLDDGSEQTVRLPTASVLRNPDEPELYLVTGSLLGMLLVLVVARYQIPAMWSRQMRALLNVALPNQVAAHLMRYPEQYDHTVRGPATVIFCDIKGFTSTVEALSLDAVKHHLELALDAVVEAHVGQDLIIDKYIGDAVMSFRGGNLVDGSPADHAYRVVRGALDGALALSALDDPYFRDIKIGGASATDALIGTFGTSKRLSYTILGDRVNLAARLEASCNALGVRALFCELTRELVGDRPDLVWRRVGTVKVQGKDDTTGAWEVFDTSEDTSWVPRFHEALAHFEARRFDDAARVFEALGDDGPSRLYLDRCRELGQGAPADWTPVLRTRK